MFNSQKMPSPIDKPKLRRVRIAGKDLFKRLLKVKTPCELLVTLGIDSPSNMTAFFSLTMEEFVQLKEDQIQCMGFKPESIRKLCKALRVISASKTLAMTINQEKSPESKEPH